MTAPKAQTMRQDAERNNGVWYAVTVPADRVFGPDFRDHLRGWSRVGSRKNPTGAVPTHFPDGTGVLATYTRTPGGLWTLYTCYPDFD